MFGSSIHRQHDEFTGSPQLRHPGCATAGGTLFTEEFLVLYSDQRHGLGFRSLSNTAEGSCATPSAELNPAQYFFNLFINC